MYYIFLLYTYLKSPLSLSDDDGDNDNIMMIMIQEYASFAGCFIFQELK